MIKLIELIVKTLVSFNENIKLLINIFQDDFELIRNGHDSTLRYMSLYRREVEMSNDFSGTAWECATSFLNFIQPFSWLFRRVSFRPDRLLSLLEEPELSQGHISHFRPKKDTKKKS
jgi:hypothetical protein